MNAKTTPSAVVEFIFNSSTFMASPHPHRGAALALTMQGRSMAIPVATMLIKQGRITDVEWETPFSGYPPEWHQTVQRLVTENADPALQEAL